MNKNLKNWLFGIGIVVVLLIPILVDYFGDKTVKVVSYDNFVETFENEDFTLVYFGDTDSEDYPKLSENLLKVKNKFDMDVKALNYNKVTEEDKLDLITQNELLDTESGYIFIENGTIKFIHQGEITEKELKVLIDKYKNNIIPEEEIEYKTAKDAASYKKAVNSKKTLMTVFGRSSCSWCNAFKPVFNDLAIEHKFDVYYFDSDVYNKDEYKKVLKIGLKIPSECSEEEATIADGTFPTPLTLFTKNGKVIDCISGYLPKEQLESKLESVGLIK